jgi:WD40 repeat protein
MGSIPGARSRVLCAATLLVAGSAEAQSSRIPTVAVISPDAALVAAQESGVVRIWDRASGKRLASFKSEGMFRGALGERALAGIVADERVAVWRAPRFQQALDVRHTPKVLSLGRVYASANGQTLATVFAQDGGVGDPNAVNLWSGATGKLVARVNLERGRVQGVALSPDGKRVAIFGDDPAAASATPPREGALLEVYALQPRAKLRVQKLLGWRGPDRTTYAAAFAPDGRRLALGASSRLLLFDVASVPSSRLLGAVETDEVKALFPAALRAPRITLGGAHQIVFAHDGRRLCTLHTLGVVGAALWEVSSAPPSRRSPLFKPARWVKRPAQGTLRQLAFDRAGGLLLITASYGPEVWVFAAAGDRFELQRTLTP